MGVSPMYPYTAHGPDAHATINGEDPPFAAVYPRHYHAPRDMQWLLHGNLTPAVRDALVRHGHTAHALDALDALGEAASAPLAELARAAQAKQWDVLTTESALVNAVFDEKIWFNRSIVFLQLEGGDVEQDDAIDRLFQRYKRLTPGRLYTVTGSRVKIRQLPARH